MDLTVAGGNVGFNGYGGFWGTGRYLTPRTYGQLRNILTAMNSEAKYIDNGKSFENTTVTKLRLHYGKDNASLTDKRFLTEKAPDNEQMKRGVTRVDMGKTHLVIDNNSGEILMCKKPFFKTWSKVMSQLRDTIYTFDSFYTMDKVVEKVKFSIHGLTEKGLEQLNKTSGKKSVPEK